MVHQEACSRDGLECLSTSRQNMMLSSMLNLRVLGCQAEVSHYLTVLTPDPPGQHTSCMRVQHNVSLQSLHIPLLCCSCSQPEFHKRPAAHLDCILEKVRASAYQLVT